MCVPVPVDAKGGNINKKGKVTGGLPAPSLDLVNQMMTPFRRAATGTNIEEQRQRFNDPNSIAAMLAPPQSSRTGGVTGPEMQAYVNNKGYRRPY